MYWRELLLIVQLLIYRHSMSRNVFYMRHF
jgi:hypothetical protein